MNIEDRIKETKQVAKTMKELFLPYDLAKLAKDKGFNLPCFAYFWDKSWKENVSDIFHYTVGYNNHNDLPSRVSAPLYAQVIDWLEKERKGIVEENLYFSFLTQKWAVANPIHPDRDTDMLSTFFESKREALNSLLNDRLKLI